MTVHELTVECPVHDSFRVRQVAGMFDVPLAAKAISSFRAEIPDAGEAWQIGLILGPSGSGKSTLARRVFGDSLYAQPAWPEDRAVVDCFGERPIKQITGLLTAVGFGSPPSWIKPYAVLSGGERFRCDLARALAGETTGSASAAQESANSIVAFDEFTSVVDRNLAQIGSAAVARAIRAGAVARRFVAVTCHYDVEAWLAPDWTVDMATGECHWRRLQRPAIELAIVRCHRDAWRLFARHHYLNGRLSPTARCYLATWRGAAVAFCATIPLIGRRGHWRITRVVTLPDFQGVGVGLRVAECVADLHRAAGNRINITASHPSVLSHCQRSPRWRMVRVMKHGRRRAERFTGNYNGSLGRAVVSFEYLGEPPAAE